MMENTHKSDMPLSEVNRPCNGDAPPSAAAAGLTAEVPENQKEQVSEDMSNSGKQSSPLKLPSCTHNNIFGDPPVSPRRAGKVYHMSSDIFGVGSIVDRAGQHLTTQPENKNSHVYRNASNEGIIGYAKNPEQELEKKTSGTRPEDWKPNARENGCNPVTGDGYAEGDAGKSQKRHYPRGRSQSLW